MGVDGAVDGRKRVRDGRCMGVDGAGDGRKGVRDGRRVGVDGAGEGREGSETEGAWMEGRGARREARGCGRGWEWSGLVRLIC